MDEQNRNKLDELLAQAMGELKRNPGDKELLRKVDILTKLCISDYSGSSDNYSKELKAESERLKIEKELELKEKEAESDKIKAEKELELKEKELELKAQELEIKRKATESERFKIKKETEFKKKELELKEQEQKQNKHNEWWNRGLKFLGIICPAAIGVGMLGSEWIGSYVNRNALPWVSKFKNFD